VGSRWPGLAGTPGLGELRLARAFPVKTYCCAKALSSAGQDQSPGDETYLSATLIACTILGFARALRRPTLPSKGAVRPKERPPTLSCMTIQVDTAFQTGTSPNFNSNTHYRWSPAEGAPGLVEIHTKDTDVFYIVGGRRPL